MAYIPTLDEAQKLLEKYNTEPFHLQHAQTVSGVMGYFAETYDPEQVDYWKVVGLLHDLDFEQYPDQHCVKLQEILRDEGVEPSIIRACASHGYSLTDTDVAPEAFMEKVLFAVDELTGLIGAVSLMRPSKSVMDLELKSVKKKFKQSSFAAGCSREVIQKGADLLDWPLDDLITEAIMAMRSLLV